MYDVVESSADDFIDGTFNSFDKSRRNIAKIPSSNDTVELQSATRCDENKEEEINYEQMELDSADESIFSVDVKKTEKISVTDSKKTNNKPDESDAFQILMTRIQLTKNYSSKQLTSEQNMLTTKNQQSLELKFEQNEDEVFKLSDKRSYAKRKLIEGEDEEDEKKIDEQSVNRSKIFKKTPSNNYIKTNSLIPNQKHLVQDLHNYFSKITPKERDETKLLAVPTMVVKADSNCEKSPTCTESLIPKISNNCVKLKTRQVLAAIDDIQILRSETTNPSLTKENIVEESPEGPPQRQHKKPKWSLRINFHTSDQDYDIIDEGVIDYEKKRLKSCLIDNQQKKKQEPHLKKISKNAGKIMNFQEEVDKNVNKNKNDVNISSLGSEDEITEIYERDLNYSNKDMENSDDKNIIQVSNVEKTNEKLAPVFMKRLKPDPKVIAARRIFLHSQSPENEKKKSKCKSHVVKKLMRPFPLVSHVTQLDTDSNNHDNFYFNSKYQIKKSLTEANSFHIKYVDPCNLKDVNNTTDSTPKKLSVVNPIPKMSTEVVLQEIEQRCTDAREIWGTISSIANKFNHRLSPKKLSSKQKSIDKKLKLTNTKNVQFDVWTQKYRPLKANQVVGNEKAALKLWNWLEKWKLAANKDDYSSGEEFYNSDNSYSNLSDNNQVAVLLGPHGSGKTASVYAIAEEFGYTVLEVNASSKRSGRKILKELEEATKSHRVKKTNLKVVTRPVLSENKNIPENSLILIEDVDLIFEEDEGFISAIHQLSSNTKRPIAMTCRDSCSALTRMAPQQLRIHFQRISGPRAMALIELITLAETASVIPRPCVENLIVNGDLRKALLELQYLLQSGIHDAMKSSNPFQETLWLDIYSYLYKPIVKKSKTRTKRENFEHVRKNPFTVQDVDISLNSLADDLDAISLISSLIDINDHTLNMSQIKYEPNVSFEPNTDLYSNNRVLSIEISEWLRNGIMHKHIKNNVEIDTKLYNQLLTKKELNMNVYSTLSQVSNCILDTKILSTDYLPTVRTICRAEAVKVNNNVKRGRRFFHYLQNLRIPSATINSNILTAACKIMEERPEIPTKT